MNFAEVALRRAARRAPAGLVSLIALAHASPALADAECGPLGDDGVIICEATDDPYVGIAYRSDDPVDINVILNSGVVVDATQAKDPMPAVMVSSAGSVSVVAEAGTTLTGPIYENYMPALSASSTGGSVTVQVDKVFGEFSGIEALAHGDVSVTADYVEAGKIAIDAWSEIGGIMIDVGLAAGVGHEGVGINAATGADSTAGITINALEAYGIGDYGAAVYTLDEGSGGVAISVGGAFGSGEGSAGIVGQSVNGPVRIDVLEARTEGNYSGAVWAFSDAGNVEVNAQLVSAQGEFSQGITIGSGLGDAIITADYVGADGFGASAIVAGAANLVDIAALGVGASGDTARAIAVESFGDVSVAVAEYAGVFGNDATAIAVSAAGNVAINAARVYAYGTSAVGVSTATSGAISIAVDELVTDGGTAIWAQSGSGELNVDVGTVITGDLSGDTIALNLGAGEADANVRIRGGITTLAETGLAVRATSWLGGVSVAIDEGAVVSSGGTAIQVGSSVRSAVDIGGTVESANGPAIAIIVNDFGDEAAGEITIAATGVVRGYMSFLGGDDLVDNAGQFLTAGETAFGGGDDRFVNRGLVALGDDTAAAISFTGLERLENRGLISLANGRAGDLLTVSGTLIGAGDAALAVDLDLATGEADLIEVGDLSGTHDLRLNFLGRGSALGLKGIRIVTSAAANDGTELTLADDSASRGFVRFGLRYDGSDSWLLESDLDDAAYLGGAMAAGVRDLWHFGTNALSTHLLATRGQGEGGGVWMQAVGSDLTSKSTLAHEKGARELAWEGAHEGVQLGAEKMSGAWQVGVTAGYGSARISLGEDENSHFKAFNAGVYASYAADGWYASATMRADMIDVEFDWASVGLEDSGNGTAIGFGLEGGYRADLGGLWVEPALRFGWVDVSLPDQEAEQGRVNWKDGSAATVEGGLRIGAGQDWLGLPVRPFLAMSVAREFGGSDQTVIDLGTQEVTVTAKGDRTYGRFGGGIGYNAGRFDLYTQIDGRFGDIEGVSGLIGGRMRF